MSKITNIIPAQNYELVRNRIAEILIDEISMQLILSGNYELDLTVDIENQSPNDKTELPLINVSLINGNYGNKSYNGSITSTYQYTVDCYTNSKTINTTKGIQISTFKCHKLLGVCRYILENPIYKTLGYNAGFIQRVFISDLQIAASKNGNDDAFNTVMGRLTFNVVVTETVDLLKPTIASGYNTRIKIGNTNNGYQIITNNYM